MNGTTIEVSPLNGNFSDLGSEVTNSLALDGQSQMSGQLKAAAGTVGAPGITFGSDLDTGAYRIGGDNIGIACAGAKVLDIATTGLGVTGTLSATGAITENGAAVYKAGGTDVAVADGGTGASTATAGFNALAPTTTRGDIITRDASNNVRLAIGAADTLLKSDGTDVAYGKLVNANITDGTIAYAKLASGVSATQAIMETGTATDSFVTPGVAKHHPAHPKSFLNFTSVSSTAIVVSNGITSVTDNGTGLTTITQSTAFSSADYAPVGFARDSDTEGDMFISAKAAGTRTASALTVTQCNSGGSLADAADACVAFLGDHS